MDKVTSITNTGSLIYVRAPKDAGSYCDNQRMESPVAIHTYGEECIAIGSLKDLAFCITE